MPKHGDEARGVILVDSVLGQFERSFHTWHLGSRRYPTLWKSEMAITESCAGAEKSSACTGLMDVCCMHVMDTIFIGGRVFSRVTFQTTDVTTPDIFLSAPVHAQFAQKWVIVFQERKTCDRLGVDHKVDIQPSPH